ncbi:rhodanese-like domain-containing protein [Alkalilimnicola ehrlichii MLHE-1]|uniref:Rhodanese domain protein n=1 Tax=Alkalilimnicola ehrlichii (strain ATCC BAA-1101 / DSM 17681 / MLHE-1) TaxID=187272 RepID=Q0A8H6_ALKEH|nr:rhodanese-like domain-containing protein [Alkalilimnicola ehrlichii]ABI56861.1 Rhodanese domain protein [Alkalilimnicola ehrlichii MLHE-1]
MSWADWWPFGDVPEIAPGPLSRAVHMGEVQVLDVRSRPEFRRDHIRGAVHLPVWSCSPRQLQRLGLDRDRPVVVICLSAHRSIPVVRRLRRMGFEAMQLKGGMRAWWRHQS